jgi:membrane protein implicated in regulation of membrane protease activity
MIGRERVAVTIAGVVLIVFLLLVVLFSVAPPWSVVLILVGCALEAVEIVLLRRWSKRIDRRTKPTTGVEAMVGEAAEVVEPCQPDGMVQLNGELWEARCEAGAEKGEKVRVEAVDGLTLVVAR